ncbi:hypothetical protein M9Y10_031322 [Tritrichomonas musculus]|uniref:Uncharacterized protein n=1 Tax=Tritrichomonas musculus TaxID=1915356 RepID=A0ABR2GK97_9EUKA
MYASSGSSATSASWGNITGNILNQKDLMEKFDSKIDKIEGKGLSSNDFTNEMQDKLISVNKNYLISVDKVWSNFSENMYMQVIPVNGIKEKDIAMVCIELSDDEALADKELQVWNRVTRIIINNGSITAYIKGKMPDVSIKIRIKT